MLPTAGLLRRADDSIEGLLDLMRERDGIERVKSNQLDLPPLSDGVTDGADLAVISDNYGTQCPIGRWAR